MAGAKKLAEEERQDPDSYLSLTGVGRQWLSAEVRGYHYTRSFWLNWRTGELLEGEPGEADEILDLDRPKLAVRMCSPLERYPISKRQATDPYDNYLPFLQYEYARPYGLTNGRPDDRSLLLERCGSGRRRILSRCRGYFVRELPCHDVQLGAGLATWADNDVVGAFATRRRHIFHWRLRDPYLRRFVSHTRRWIYVWVDDGKEPRRYVARSPAE